MDPCFGLGRSLVWAEAETDFRGLLNSVCGFGLRMKVWDDGEDENEDEAEDEEADGDKEDDDDDEEEE